MWRGRAGGAARPPAAAVGGQAAATPQSAPQSWLPLPGPAPPPAPPALTAAPLSNAAPPADCVTTSDGALDPPHTVRLNWPNLHEAAPAGGEEWGVDHLIVHPSWLADPHPAKGATDLALIVLLDGQSAQTPVALPDAGFELGEGEAVWAAGYRCAASWLGHAARRLERGRSRGAALRFEPPAPPGAFKRAAAARRKHPRPSRRPAAHPASLLSLVPPAAPTTTAAAPGWSASSWRRCPLSSAPTASPPTGRCAQLGLKLAFRAVF